MFVDFGQRNPEAPRGGYPLPLRFPDSGVALQIRNGKKKKNSSVAPLLEIGTIILWIIFGHFGAVQVWIMLNHVWLRSTFTKETQVTSFFAIGQKKNDFQNGGFHHAKYFFPWKGAPKVHHIDFCLPNSLFILRWTMIRIIFHPTTQKFPKDCLLNSRNK